jgi:ABC-type nitrate/sulfonate/bicarbonate transport system substrate-binding protein
MLLVISALLFCACAKTEPKLRLGFIKPSINHLPLSLLLQQNKIAGIKLVYFSSGWEAQEALISGKIDTAILQLQRNIL